MSTNDSQNNAAAADANPYASVAELKTAHSDLLKRYREELGARSSHEGKNAPALLRLLPQIKDFISRGRATGVIIEAEDERTASQTYLDYWVSVIYRSGIDREGGAHYEATLADFDPDLAPALPEELCPYIGLDAFQEQDQGKFFGREALVKEMLKKLEAVRLLSVVGPSGSGKSSAVLAGLVPALKAGGLPGSKGWRYYPPMVPGANPLRNLALALRPRGESAAAWVEKQAGLFMEDAGHLRKLLNAAADGGTCVLLIDQFEEVFTLCNDKELLAAFVDNLHGLVTSEGVPHRVVLTIRIEYQEQMARLTELYTPFQKGLVQAMALSEEGLREAIERPAAAAKLEFQKGVVDAIVKEIVGEPAGLPLLQFTLLELWKRRRRNRITLDAYESLGGARRALTEVANKFYQRLLPQEQYVAQRLLLRLAWTGEGVQVLRNRARRKELHQAGGSSDQVDEVLRKLVGARLVRVSRDEFAEGSAPSPDDQFEVAHEALIRNWLMRVKWFQDEREALRLRIRLRSAAEQWNAHDREPGGLIGGAQLVEMSKFTDLDDLEKAFLQASDEAEKAVVREREEVRQREIASWEALANEKARAANRLWYLIAVLALGIVASGGAAVYALSQQTEAQRQASIATMAATIATEEKEAADTERQRAEHLRREATTQFDLAERARQDAITAQGVAERARGVAIRQAEELRLQGIQLTKANTDLKAKGELLTKANEDLTTQKGLLTKANEDLTTQKGLLTAANEALEIAKAEATTEAINATQAKNVAEAALKEAKESIAVLQKTEVDRALELNSCRNDLGRAQQALTTQTGFSADAKKLLTFSTEGGARVWNVQTGAFLLDAPQNQPTAAILSGNGKLMVTANTYGDVAVTDVEKGMQLQQLHEGVAPEPTKLVLSSDSTKLAALDRKGSVKVIELRSGRTLAEVKETENAVVGIAFSPDGKRLALIDSSGQTKLVQVENNRQVITTLTSRPAGCRPTAVDLLKLTPSPDVRAAIHLETTCKGEGNPRAESTVSKGLTPEQAAILQQPAPKKAKPSADAGQRETVQNVLAPADGRTPPTAKSYQSPETEVIISFKVEKRDESREFKDFASFEMNSSNAPELSKALLELSEEGLSQDNVLDISRAIIDFVNQVAELPKTGSEAEQRRLTTELYKKIMRELDLPSVQF